jgi:hypothetical protein
MAYSTLITTALRMVILVCASAILMESNVSASPVQCYLEVNGHVYLNGTCNFEADQGGSFSIGTGDQTRSRYFAYINIDAGAGVVRGYWNGEEGASHAHWELGNLIRQGACWVNDHAKICARK